MTSSIRPYGSFRAIVKVLSSFFERSFTRAIMCWPAPSRAAQRRIDATTSSAVTAAPSENFSPSRSSNV